MANEEHLKILKQGARAWRWNKWRRENSDVEVDLSEANLTRANLAKANLSEADLRETDLRWANLSEAKLSEANLISANLRKADLSWTDLSEADLTGADLSEANLTRANLTKANLKEAKLIRADLREADLHRSHLSGADLQGANLSRATLTGTVLTEAVIGATIFGEVNLSLVEDLETVEHEGPSTIGVDTIYRSEGNIPESFLRGAGVPESFFTYMRSLVIEPIEFYSCFISYSSKDGNFAKRLHADLKAEKVRCWFADEDMKTGDKIRDSIEESIRVYDKVMVILSDNSIASDWVEHEVEAAFEKERKTGGLVLFPIRLDAAVMDSDRGWARNLCRQRHIGDFINWKDHDKYQRAFERLLKDLKAGEADV